MGNTALVVAPWEVVDWFADFELLVLDLEKVFKLLLVTKNLLLLFLLGGSNFIHQNYRRVAASSSLSGWGLFDLVLYRLEHLLLSRLPTVKGMVYLAVQKAFLSPNLGCFFGIIKKFTIRSWREILFVAIGASNESIALILFIIRCTFEV